MPPHNIPAKTGRATVKHRNGYSEMYELENSREDKKGLSRSGVMAIIAPFRWLIVQAVVLFVAAGHLDMPRAWIYLCLNFVFSTAGVIIIWKLMPELLNRRGGINPGTKPWDKVILLTYFPIILFIMPLIAGLDVGRYKWSNLSVHFTILGIALYAFAFLIAQWAMVENRFFEGTMRIQEDREHIVITTGPYRIVRHPGYVGMILASLSPPLIIGSLYALIPAGLGIILIIMRTFLEDKTLRNELNGYSKYTEEVRYRLVPGIW
jgi:protein-S-isoprenylcysteine O-methyltransferase Ste14